MSKKKKTENHFKLFTGVSSLKFLRILKCKRETLALPILCSILACPLRSLKPAPLTPQKPRMEKKKKPCSPQFYQEEANYEPTQRHVQGPITNCSRKRADGCISIHTVSSLYGAPLWFLPRQFDSCRRRRIVS